MPSSEFDAELYMLSFFTSLSIHSILYKDFEGCPINLDIYMVITAISLFLGLLLAFIAKWGPCKKFWTSLRVISIVLSILMVSAATPILIFTAISKFSCVKGIGIYVILVLFLGIIDLSIYILVLLVVFLFFKAVFRIARRKRHQKRTQKIYKNIYKMNQKSIDRFI